MPVYINMLVHQCLLKLVVLTVFKQTDKGWNRRNCRRILVFGQRDRVIVLACLPWRPRWISSFFCFFAFFFVFFFLKPLCGLAPGFVFRPAHLPPLLPSTRSARLQQRFSRRPPNCGIVCHKQLNHPPPLMHSEPVQKPISILQPRNRIIKVPHHSFGLYCPCVLSSYLM